MIDDPWKTDLLISMLKESLPLEANITQYLAGALMEKSPDMTVPKKCNVTSVFYTGDMGRYSLRFGHGWHRDRLCACGFHNSSGIRPSCSSVARDRRLSAPSNQKT